jgi:hypothetical protein
VKLIPCDHCKANNLHKHTGHLYAVYRKVAHLMTYAGAEAIAVTDVELLPSQTLEVGRPYDPRLEADESQKPGIEDHPLAPKVRVVHSYMDEQ